jgi:hypothetical protein
MGEYLQPTETSSKPQSKEEKVENQNPEKSRLTGATPMTFGEWCIEMAGGFLICLFLLLPFAIVVHLLY